MYGLASSSSEPTVGVGHTSPSTYTPQPAGSAASLRPLLWVARGSGLHEMEACDDAVASEWSELPRRVLSRFPPELLRSHVVWQTVGGGFTKRSLGRYKGACAMIDARQVADDEVCPPCPLSLSY
eukprot:6563210-Prymnesium_polylepis.3